MAVEDIARIRPAAVASGEKVLARLADRWRTRLEPLVDEAHARRRQAFGARA
jgi:hypothetical protein